MSESHTQWWTSSGLSRRARLGTAVIAALLAIAVLAVWTSPRGLALADAPPVSAEQAALEQRVADLTASLEARQRELDALTASQAKADAERAAGKVSGALKAQSDHEAAAEASAAKAAADKAAAAAKAEVDKAAAARAAASQAAKVAAANSSASAARARAASAEAQAEQMRKEAAARPAAPTTPSTTPVASRPTAPSLASLISTSTRQYGIYTPQSPFSWAEVDDVTTKVGVAPSMIGYFQGWDGDFRADAVTRAWERNMLPLLTWESRPLSAANDQPVDSDYSLPTIIGDPATGTPGAFDDYLHRYARDIAALGLPLGIRLDQEMNASWYPWGERTTKGTSLNGNGPGDFVAMWKHVHDIFEAEGANAYVMWIWAPNIVNNLPDYASADSSYLASLYPGDEYVDWVGLSGYYRPPYKTGQTATFAYTFDRSLDQLREVAPGKPILLAEVGASEIGNNKPAWVTDFFSALTQPQYADVIGFAWFHYSVTTIVSGERVTNDWRVTSRDDSLQAFVTGLTNPAAGFVSGSTP